jgi:hypothetical protein
MTDDAPRTRPDDWSGPDASADKRRPAAVSWDDVSWPVTYGPQPPEVRPHAVEAEVERERPPEQAPEPAVIPEVASGPTIGRGLRKRLEQRLVALNDAIALYPDASSNYVLRGELYLRAKVYALAAADFERAIALADEQMATSDWGLVAQAVQDRAQQGLKRAKRHLR